MSRAERASAAPSFAARLIAWQREHGRHGLPWQGTRDAYRIWLSEIMLQQTQVASVIAYYQRFVARFASVAALAAAEEDEVLQLWSGLGYYSRARNLHRAAHMIVEQHGGVFPQQLAAIEALPGIGRSTAAAIGAFAFGARCAILDGNVKRVLARHRGVEGFPGDKRVENALWSHAETLLPQHDIETYTQALMDLGATVCLRTKPLCAACPVQTDCVAHAQQRTHALPAPRPKKAYPEKSTVMLILLDGGDVLLQKRPPTGIWGGMWSFPEFGVDADIEHACRMLGVSAQVNAPWPELVHGFTHFRLRIRPLIARVRTRTPAAEQPGSVWLNVEEAIGAAIPKPVRVLLQQVCKMDGLGMLDNSDRA